MTSELFRRARRVRAALLLGLIAFLLLPLATANATGSTPGAGPTSTPTAAPTPGTPLGATKPSAPSLKFGIGPANRVPKKQVVDGRPYLVYSVNPGATIFDKIAIFNYGVKPLRLQLYPTDATSTTDGAFTLIPGGVAPTDVGSWITLQGIPKNGIVTVPGRVGKAPFGVLRIPFLARVPTSATPGDHQGGVVASIKTTSKNTKGANITLDQRIAVRAYFAVTGTLTPSVQIEDLHASYTHPWDPLGRGLYAVSYYVHNRGNLRLNVSQDLNIGRCIIPAILCPAGDLVAHPAELKDLLPGARVLVTQVFNQRFGLGRPKATVTLHATPLDLGYTKKIPDVSDSASFWALPWLLIIEILLVLVLLGLGGWRYERRRRLKKRELEAAALAPRPKHAGPPNEG